MPRLATRTGILIPHTVTNLAGFVNDFEQQLVWVAADPAGAAIRYRARLRTNPYGGDGVVCLSYRGQELLGPKQWDDVDGIWRELVEAVAGYLDAERGRQSNQGVAQFSLLRAGRSTTFGVGPARYWVEPTEFVPDLLDAAWQHFSWLQQHVGRAEPQMLDLIARLRRS